MSNVILLELKTLNSIIHIFLKITAIVLFSDFQSCVYLCLEHYHLDVP